MRSRAVLVIVAILVIGWIAVLERDHRLQSRAQSRLGQLADDAVFHGTDRDLRDAQLLNPDTEPELTRAYVHQSRGDLRAAVRIAERVVRREPRNILAWGLIYSAATAAREPGRAARARRMIDRLDPLNARRG